MYSNGCGEITAVSRVCPGIFFTWFGRADTTATDATRASASIVRMMTSRGKVLDKTGGEATTTPTVLWRLVVCTTVEVSAGGGDVMIDDAFEFLQICLTPHTRALQYSLLVVTQLRKRHCLTDSAHYRHRLTHPR